MSIGERIKARREELGMSQEELATLLGYKSRSSINKIELGGNELTQKKIQSIATALGVTPAYIMGWEDTESKLVTNSLTSQEQLLLSHFRELNEEGQERAIESVQGLVVLGRYEKNYSDSDTIKKQA